VRPPTLPPHTHTWPSLSFDSPPTTLPPTATHRAPLPPPTRRCCPPAHRRPHGRRCPSISPPTRRRHPPTLVLGCPRHSASPLTSAGASNRRSPPLSHQHRTPISSVVDTDHHHQARPPHKPSITGEQPAWPISPLPLTAC
jgi:hypothetical protein